MKRITGVFLGATVLSLGSVAAIAQQPQGEGIIVSQQRIVQGSGQNIEVPPPGPGNIVFIASEMTYGGKVVKGAPYSAQAITETTQTLGDGNRITNRNSTTVYRDSEGRTRREINLKGLGPFGNGAEPLQTVFIHDPVSGVTYALDSKTHTAIKTESFKAEWIRKGGETAVAGGRFQVTVKAPPTEGGVVSSGPVGGSVGVAAPMAIHEAGQLTFKTEGSGTSYVFKRTGPDPNEVKQDLGKQLVEGVEAVGTRSTVTIPAGEIGNDRAIEIVSERWYSEELQLVVMTRNSDPRSGETIYKLTNINRSEPAKTLFEVPAGYTVKEGPSVSPFPPGTGARVRKLANPE